MIWLTGLPCSGKTSIAIELAKRIKESIVLDGDDIRDIFNNDDYSMDGRIKHNINVGRLAVLLEKQGYTVIVSLVSPFIVAREEVRSFADKFIEVYVSTSLEVCEQRDIRGMYAKARKGEIINFTGISQVYEPPINPELVIKDMDVEESVNLIIQKFF